MFELLMRDARKRRTVRWLRLMSNSSKCSFDNMIPVDTCTYCSRKSIMGYDELTGMEVGTGNYIEVLCFVKVLCQYQVLTTTVDILLTIRYGKDDGLLSSFPLELQDIILDNLLNLYYIEI